MPLVGALLVLLGTASASGGASPNPLADDQWYLGAIRAPATLPPLRQVQVALLDAGVDGEHPDLAGRIAGARRFAGGDPLYPHAAHGTATAGLIAAIRGNGVGIDGIAPNARLLSAGVSRAGADGVFDDRAVEEAIRWAADRGARVLSLSLAGSGSRPGVHAAVDYAVARGVLVVAAAGNCWEAGACPLERDGVWPAWLPHVLAVGATGGDGAPAPFSVPSRRWVDLAAPGTLIATLWPTRNNPYAATPDCPHLGTTACYWTGTTPNHRWGPSGTSYAVPMVAAAAAILFGADPELQPGQVTRLLAETATPVADPGHRAGAGIVNVEAALARLRAGRIPPADYAEPNERTAAPLPGPRRVAATLDWRDDPSDRYALRARGRVTVRTHGSARGAVHVVSGGRTIAAGPLGRPLAFRLAGRRTATIEVTAAVGSHGGYTLAVRT